MIIVQRLASRFIIAVGKPERRCIEELPRQARTHDAYRAGPSACFVGSSEDQAVGAQLTGVYALQVQGVQSIENDGEDASSQIVAQLAALLENVLKRFAFDVLAH